MFFTERAFEIHTYLKEKDKDKKDEQVIEGKMNKWSRERWTSDRGKDEQVIEGKMNKWSRERHLGSKYRKDK